MPNLAPAADSTLDLAGNNLVLVYAVLAIAVIALVFGLFFRRQVLAADPGTENMQTIGAAVEEGAQAYLNRQFRTLSIFVVLVFGLLFLLPADTMSVKLGRSIFFVVGAIFSALIGYLGMSLAVKANVRVASAARDGKSAPTSSARSRRASLRTTRATRPPSPTTSATTSATAPAWPPTSSSRMR